LSGVCGRWWLWFRGGEGECRDGDEKMSKIIKSCLILFSFTLMFCVTTPNSSYVSTSLSQNQEKTHVDLIPIDLTLKGTDIFEYVQTHKNDFAKEFLSDTKGYYYAEEVNYEEGSLLIVWAYNNLYFPERSRKYSSGAIGDIVGLGYFVRFFWKNNGSVYEKPLNNKWFLVNNTPSEVTLKTNTPDKIRTHDDTSFGFLGDGEASLVIIFLNKNIGLNIKIEIVPFKSLLDFPFNEVTKADDLIRMWGFPDDKKVISVSWPKVEIIDGMLFGPKAGETMSREHWRYKKYPDLVLQFALNNGTLLGATTTRNPDLYYEWNRHN